MEYHSYDLRTNLCSNCNNDLLIMTIVDIFFTSDWPGRSRKVDTRRSSWCK